MVHLIFCALFIFFFFSSRRRHTRSDRDWSSDVCSSDLVRQELISSTRESREDLTVKHANASCNKNESLGRRARGLTRVGGAWGLMVRLAAAAALAQAQAPRASAAAPAPKPAGTSLPWKA